VKKLLLIGLLFSPSPHAQVVECPKHSPSVDSPVSEVSYRHRGVGNVAKAPLTGGSMYSGEPKGAGAELMGERKMVKGGHNVLYGFGPEGDKWLACWYGADRTVQWWEKLDAKVTGCNVEVRTTGLRKDYPGDPISVKATCK
jgi:hypothetical protein